MGEAIPFVSFGYKTLLEFINSISFVKVRRNYFGDSVLHVSDPKTAHIESLVSKQKNPSSRISNSKVNSSILVSIVSALVSASCSFRFV